MNQASKKKANEIKILHANEKDILELIRIVEKIKKQMAIAEPQMNKFIQKIADVFKEDISRKEVNALKDFFKNYKPKHFATSYVLFLLAYVLFPHKYHTTYPDETINYNENLGIVKAREPLIKVVREEIDSAKELLTYFEDAAKNMPITPTPPTV